MGGNQWNLKRKASKNSRRGESTKQVVPTGLFEVETDNGQIESRCRGRSRSKSIERKRSKRNTPVQDSPARVQNSLNESHDNLEQFDENNPDYVKVAVDASEEREFAMEDEDLEVESENEAEQPSITNSQGLPDETNDVDSVIKFNHRVRTVDDGSMTSAGFEHLKENPAFQDYVKSLVAVGPQKKGEGILMVTD